LTDAQRLSLSSRGSQAARRRVWNIHASMPPSRGRLVWSDEFNKPKIDETKWMFETSPPQNEEQEEYTARDLRTARIEDGSLVINAIRDKVNDKIISARLSTLHRFNFTHGVIEAKMRVPFVPGIWPAFWMLGTSIMWDGWPACGEIDIMEVFGTRKGLTACSCVHNLEHSWGTHDPLDGGCASLESDPYGWHVWSAVWTPRGISFYIDDEAEPLWGYERPLPATKANYPYTSPQFLVANLAVGGNGPAQDLDRAALEPPGVTFAIDYVRVFALSTDWAQQAVAAELSQRSDALGEAWKGKATNTGAWIRLPSTLADGDGGAFGQPLSADALPYASPWLSIILVGAAVSGALAMWRRQRQSRLPSSLSEGLLLS